MAEITAAMVRQLRERSGLPMMDCKQALTEAGGDEEKAMEILRKSGKAAAEKKVGRTTGEGRIGAFRNEKAGALVELLCESAPVSNNPIFVELANKVAQHAALSADATPENIRQQNFAGGSGTVDDLFSDAINKLRENMQVGRIARVEGRTGVYVHHNGRVGVIIGIEGNPSNDAVLSDICMHVAAMSPAAVNRDQMPAEAVEKEKEIAREQIIASGKPANMVDKILTGKMDRWFSERVLTEQPFVKDDKKTVGQVAKEAGITITSFHRMQVGE